jgi:hypothetical protein
MDDEDLINFKNKVRTLDEDISDPRTPDLGSERARVLVER